MEPTTSACGGTTRGSEANSEPNADDLAAESTEISALPLSSTEDASSTAIDHSNAQVVSQQGSEQSGTGAGSPLISLSPLPVPIGSSESFGADPSQVSNPFDFVCEDLTTADGPPGSNADSILGGPFLDFGFGPTPPSGENGTQQLPPETQSQSQSQPNLIPAMELLSFSPVAPSATFECDSPATTQEQSKVEEQDLGAFEASATSCDSVKPATDDVDVFNQEEDQQQQQQVKALDFVDKSVVDVERAQHEEEEEESAISTTEAKSGDSSADDGLTHTTADISQKRLSFNDEPDISHKLDFEAPDQADQHGWSSSSHRHDDDNTADGVEPIVPPVHCDEHEDFVHEKEEPSDDFGSFQTSSASGGDMETGPALEKQTPSQTEDDEFGDFSTCAQEQSEIDDFGGFANTSAPSVPTDPHAENDFGGFSQSIAPSTNGTAIQVGNQTDDDDFGDFGGFTDSASADKSGDDDDFGDFGQATASTNLSFTAPNPPVSVPSNPMASPPLTATPSVAALSTESWTEFFLKAFPRAREAASASEGSNTLCETSALVSDYESQKDETCDSHKHFVTSFHRLNDVWASETREIPGPSSDSQATNHIKFVLDAKIHEANRLEGVFGSQQETSRTMFAAALKSEDEDIMLDAISKLQHLLLEESVNEATMRIAKQAAVSAKARIAEQVSQQSTSRASSLFASTRHMLARSSSDRESTMSVLTPTGASVHKLARYSFGSTNASQTASDAGSTGGNANNGSATGEDASVLNTNATNSANSTPDESQLGHDRNSDVVSISSTMSDAGSALSSSVPMGTALSSTSSVTTVEASTSEAFPAASSSGRGGFMKKFQDRLTSFSSSRFGIRTVNLRRTGKSGQEVRKMELNMDQVNGGFDEVKWKCAVFLYDVEEVSQVAPSQITILSHPGKQMLACKTGRGALIKFLKPGTVWTIDIGKTEYDSANE